MHRTPTWMTAVLKRTNADRTAVREALASRELLVVGLCAAWCNTCGEFLDAFERVASDTRRGTFLWLDIEDDADLVGDIDVENFPTLAIFDRTRPVHFGVSLPQLGQLSRLIRALGPDSQTASVEQVVQALPRAIERWAELDD